MIYLFFSILFHRLISIVIQRVDEKDVMDGDTDVLLLPSGGSG